MQQNAPAATVATLWEYTGASYLAGDRGPAVAITQKERFLKGNVSAGQTPTARGQEWREKKLTSGTKSRHHDAL
ncbi:hypothetical protein NPX13_g7964 [Xylaria arbuscula]|uniref:Uncharacterized protein n=1 Tax=Xylaria arbuscula TaxID=114810 RepID=A0A9W8N9V9_9PEZI|nr:hypothetical protein NPX13_g7964 [Xylaria arbuscula]